MIVGTKEDSFSHVDRMGKVWTCYINKDGFIEAYLSKHDTKHHTLLKRVVTTARRGEDIEPFLNPPKRVKKEKINNQLKMNL